MFVKQHNSTIKLSGFTLIEILVTIGILIIMSALAVFSFTRSNPERLLNLTAENIIGQLQQAQSLSFTGAKQGATAPNGYGVFIDYDNKEYKVYADTSIVGLNINHYDTSDAIIGESYDIPSQLTLETKSYSDNFLAIKQQNINIDIFFTIPNAYLNIYDGITNPKTMSSEIILTFNSIQKIIKIRADSNSFWIE